MGFKPISKKVLLQFTTQLCIDRVIALTTDLVVMGGSASVVDKKKSYHSSEVKSMYAEHWDEGKHGELIDDEGMVCGVRLHDAVIEHHKSQAALGEYDSKVDDENCMHDENYEDSSEEEEGGNGPRPEQGIQRRSSAIADHLAGRRQSTHRFEADRRGSATQLEPIPQRPPEQQEPPDQQPSPGTPTISKRASFFSTPEQVSGVGGSCGHGWEAWEEMEGGSGHRMRLRWDRAARALAHQAWPS